VAPLRKAEIISEGNFIGSLLPRYQYTVSSQIGGRLSSLKVRVGDQVKQKQLLAEIENDEVVQQVEQALADVRVASALLDEQTSRLQRARQEYNRTRALNQKNLISQTDRETAEANFKIETAKRKVVEAQLSQKRSLLKAARTRLSYTRILAQWVSRPLSVAQTKELMEASETLDGAKEEEEKKESSKESKKDASKNGKKAPAKKAPAKKAPAKKAPAKKAPAKKEPVKKNGASANGQEEEDAYRLVGERLVDEGSIIQPNIPMLTLLDIRSLIAVVHVTEKDYIQIRVGQTARARTYVYKNRSFSGKVVRIAPLLKESSRLARVEVEFPNADLALKPGMFVHVQIEYERFPAATVAPRAALVNRNGKDGVFLADLTKKEAHFQPLQIGVRRLDAFQILSPAIQGHVVTLGYHLLEDKAAISLPGDKPAEKKGKGGARKGREGGSKKGERKGRGGGRKQETKTPPTATKQGATVESKAAAPSGRP
jgi:multidrug efflux pump subunit AcrA (membrane-fusion protein)